jgi:hypothetical protein
VSRKGLDGFLIIWCAVFLYVLLVAKSSLRKVRNAKIADFADITKPYRRLFLSWNRVVGCRVAGFSVSHRQCGRASLACGLQKLSDDFFFFFDI